MRLITDPVSKVVVVAGSVGTRPGEFLDRLKTRAKRGVLAACRPLILTLGMSDKPWGALLWLVLAVLLALLFVITFVMFEGSMWT